MSNDAFGPALAEQGGKPPQAQWVVGDDEPGTG